MADTNPQRISQGPKCRVLCEGGLIQKMCNDQFF